MNESNERNETDDQQLNAQFSRHLGSEIDTICGGNIHSKKPVYSPKESMGSDNKIENKFLIMSAKIFNGFN